MPKPKILIVEDDPDTRRLILYNIKNAGFEAIASDDGYQGLTLARRDIPDLIVLDVMLPGLDGFEVCKELKKSPDTAAIPIIMVTAKGDEVDRVVGLEIGADDYVVKPFSPRELILRVKSVLRRHAPDAGGESSWRVQGLRVDESAHRVFVDETEVAFTATEFKLLAELLRSRGKVLTRDQLLNRVWESDFEGYARTVDTHIRRVRQKLGPYEDMIETVRGIGYRFKDAE